MDIGISIITDRGSDHNRGGGTIQYVSVPLEKAMASIDYGARLYDPAIGRWLSPDPLSGNYHATSPYAFCAGNPVNIVDPDGEKLYYAKGVSSQFKEQFAKTIKFMNSKGTAGDIAKLHASKHIYYIAEATKTSKFVVTKDPKTKTIYWNPYRIIEHENGIQISPATVLAHEAAHAQRYDEGLDNENAMAARKEDIKKNSDSQYGTKEERRVIEEIEQMAARKHGDIRRDQVTRKTHKEKKIKLIPTVDNNPEDIQRAVFEHNNVY